MWFGPLVEWNLQNYDRRLTLKNNSIMKTKKFLMTTLLVMGMVIAKAANGFPPELVLVSQPVLTYNANSVTVYYDVQNIGDYTYRGNIFVYLDPDDGYYYAKKWVRVCPGRIKRVAITIPAYRPNPSWVYTVMPYYELGNELYSFTVFEYFEPVRFHWYGYRNEPWVVIHVGPRPRHYHRPCPYRFYYDGYRPILPPPPGGYPPGYFDHMAPLNPYHHTYGYHHTNGGYPANYHPTHVTPGYHHVNDATAPQATVRPSSGTSGSMSGNGSASSSSNNNATTRPSSSATSGSMSGTGNGSNVRTETGTISRTGNDNRTSGRTDSGSSSSRTDSNGSVSRPSSDSTRTGNSSTSSRVSGSDNRTSGRSSGTSSSSSSSSSGRGSSSTSSSSSRGSSSASSSSSSSRSSASSSSSSSRVSGSDNRTSGRSSGTSSSSSSGRGSSSTSSSSSSSRGSSSASSSSSSSRSGSAGGSSRTR